MTELAEWLRAEAERLDRQGRDKAARALRRILERLERK